MAKKKSIPSIEYNPIIEPKRAHNYENVRWVENVSRGLRLVGFADEIARAEGCWRSIDHTGWFTMDDGINGESLRGIVYQLPARNRECLYVYGYADPCNDGCALLCFDTVSDKMKAARAADRFAELFAEEQRDYNRAWQAGRKYEELAEEIKQARTEALSIAEEMRTAKRAKVEAPTICATLRAKVLSLYRSIQKMREERAELLDNFGECAGFNDA